MHRCFRLFSFMQVISNLSILASPLPQLLLLVVILFLFLVIFQPSRLLPCCLSSFSLYTYNLIQCSLSFIFFSASPFIGDLQLLCSDVPSLSASLLLLFGQPLGTATGRLCMFQGSIWRLSSPSRTCCPTRSAMAPWRRPSEACSRTTPVQATGRWSRRFRTRAAAASVED